MKDFFRLLGTVFKEALQGSAHTIMLIILFVFCAGYILWSHSVINQLQERVQIAERNFNWKLKAGLEGLEMGVKHVLKEKIQIGGVVRATITAYTPSKNETDSTPYETAFLKKVNPRTVAVSRNAIERLGLNPGSKIWIEGLGIFEVGDIMNKRYGEHEDHQGFYIDLFMFDKKSAIEFGRQKRLVAILDEDSIKKRSLEP